MAFVLTKTLLSTSRVQKIDGISASSDSLFSRRFWPSKPIPVPQCDDVPGCGERHGSGVVRSCINCFREGRSLYRYQYGLGTYEYMLKLRDGTCTIASSDPASEVIDRANRLLKKGFGTYDVGLNNCEDFALYCKTHDTWISSKQIFSWLNIVVGFIFSLALSRFIYWPVVAFVAAPLYHYVTLYIVELNVQRR